MLIYYTSACSNAPSLGAAYGGRIADSRFSTASIDSNFYSAKNGRLKWPSIWLGTENALREYLEVDLGGVFWVCNVATQGSYAAGQWMTKYKIDLSINYVNWNIYQQNGSDKVGPV